MPITIIIRALPKVKTKKILRMGLRAKNFSSDLTKAEVLERKEIIESEIRAKLSESSLGELDFRVTTKKGKNCYVPRSISQSCLLNYLSTYLGWIYNAKINNRNEVIRCLKAHLKDTSPMTIFRTDIFKFYESIDREVVKKKVISHPYIPEKNKSLFREYFNELDRLKIKGLPRGVGLSGTMSELYMEDFDKECRQLEDVIFYSRYVDDIIIIFFGKKKISELNKQIAEILKSCAANLELKKAKTKAIQIPREKDVIKTFEPFDFLGYHFSPPEKKNLELPIRQVKISLSNRKINEYKRKLATSFICYTKSSHLHAFETLKDRIKYLTGNIIVPNNQDNRELKSGIYYNYPELSNADDGGLKDLDNFLKMLIFSKSCRVTNASTKLTRTQKNVLAKYSFRRGYELKFTARIEFEELINITKVF